MIIQPGHGLYLKIPFFADGTVPEERRTFLVIAAHGNIVSMLNV
jgi:hypothetical protein